MNILITSVGRRSYIVNYFKKALGDGSKVHVSNSEWSSAAFSYADAKVISPKIYDDEYIPFLLNYCKQNEISMIISLFDIDQLVLSKNIALFEDQGICVIVSDQKFVEICNDKWETNRFLTEQGLSSPNTYIDINDVIHDLKEKEIFFPIVVKPRYGCGSIGIEYAYDYEELVVLEKICKRKIKESYLKYESSVTEKNVIFQEKIDGVEYGVDLINDLKGCGRSMIIKEKMAMRSGETDICHIVFEPAISKAMTYLAKKTKHIGNLDCDLIYDGKNVYIIDMNARFGGGYPFSYEAGVDLPSAIIKWYKGEDVKEEELICKGIGKVYCKEIKISEIYSI